MKKFFLILFFVFVPVWAQAQTGTIEYIPNIDTTLDIKADSTVNISEQIRYDFGPNQRHGIFRDIPVKYVNGATAFNLKISNVSVTNDQGQPQQFTTSFAGNNFEIKIGDPNVLIGGIHTYIVKYKVAHAINYFSDHDELYWNVVGTDWNVPIGVPSAAVTLPKNVPAAQMTAACFLGVLGSSTPCQSNVADGIVNFVSGQNLSPHEGMTIVVSWPKGIVAEPNRLDRVKEFLADNWTFALPILALIVLIYLWDKKGRDPRGRGVIVAQYEAPEQLTPIEVGTIVDNRVDPRDISAELIYLATIGYLKITNIETSIFGFKQYDYQLDLLKPSADLPNEFDRNLLADLFSGSTAVKISELKNKFVRQSRDLTKAVYKTLTDGGYFASRPDTIRTAYTGIGIVVIWLSVFSSPYLASFGLPATFGTVASFILIGILVIAFGSLMVKRTEKGVTVREQIEGLKLYLNVAEKDRLEFHNAPEKSPAVFEKLLPFAMALKVEKEWAKQFEGIYQQPPSWYVGPRLMYFSATNFTDSLGNFSKSANMTFASAGASGMSGGGVGGGGGGGGGGSW